MHTETRSEHRSGLAKRLVQLLRVAAKCLLALIGYDIAFGAGRLADGLVSGHGLVPPVPESGLGPLYTVVALTVMVGLALAVARVPGGVPSGLSFAGWRSLALSGLGIAIGMAAQIAPLLALAALGLITLSGHPPPALGPLFLTNVRPALAEEILFRGWLYLSIRGEYGSVWAARVTAILFGLWHGYPLAIILIIPIGYLFAIARERTQALWLPVGLHFGWDFGVDLMDRLFTSQFQGTGFVPTHAALVLNVLALLALGLCCWPVLSRLQRQAAPLGRGASSEG